MDYRPPCQDGYAENWFIEEPHKYPADVARVEAICRTQCPLARQVKCARDALLNGENWGTWAGITLVGTSSCKKDEQAARKERLRLIAGMEQCYRNECRRWFQVTEHNEGTLAAAHSETLDLPHKQLMMCPQCHAAQENTQAPATTPSIETTRRQATNAVGEDNPDHDYYWTSRQVYSSLDDERPDWMLIRPNGTPEGRYAWSVAAHGFGRGLNRLRDMLAGGWTIREATIADQDWHRPRPRPRAVNTTARTRALTHRHRHADQVPA